MQLSDYMRWMNHAHGVWGRCRISNDSDVRGACNGRGKWLFTATSVNAPRKSGVKIPNWWERWRRSNLSLSALPLQTLSVPAACLGEFSVKLESAGTVSQ